MRFFKLLKPSLITLVALSFSPQAKANSLKVLKVETAEKSQFIYETIVQFEVISDPQVSRTVLEIHFDGTLRAPNKLNPDSLIAFNQDGSLLAFNMRLGVDIYNIYLAAATDDSATTFPSLNQLIGAQIKRVDSALNEQSFIITEISKNQLKFKYIGKEVSPNYFEFHANIENGEVIVDAIELKETIKSLGL